MLSSSNMKRYGLVVALVTLGGLCSAELAQSQTTYTLQLQGIEISPGVVDETKDIRYGVAFAGRSTADLPGLFAAAVNYTPSSPGPGVTNVIIGGSWAVTVIQNRRIIGTLYGQVTDGTAAWDGAGKTADVTADVMIKGGTKMFLGKTGSGHFDGVLDHTPLERKRPPTLVGTLTLDF